jgi:hypothetical protein
MKFGGLSENEVKKITDILNQEGISFSLNKDDEIEEFNKASMRNNLRHYAPPHISTHILAITIEDHDFHKLSDSGRAQLLVLGITDEAPAPEDFQPHTGETIHKELVEGPIRMVAYNFKHQLILGLVILFAFYLFKKF